MVLHNLELSDGGGCAIDYCVDVENIGCREVTAAALKVSIDGGADEQPVQGLAPGKTQRICGRLHAAPAGKVMVYEVTAEIDPHNQVQECTEVADASSCSSAEGWDSLTETVEVDCANTPPVCAAGGPYMASCESAAGITAVPLDGTGSYDPDSDTLSFGWPPTARTASLRIRHLKHLSCTQPFLTATWCAGSPLQSRTPWDSRPPAHHR